MKPLVSICIPTYNGSQYLRECLDSVLSQSFSNYQVIIVDDQSSDNTWEIVNQYASQDNRITLFKNERNLGLVGNWNRCIELACGEWIKFVFQDDLIAPECLERMLNAARPDSSFIFCRRDFIFEAGTTQFTRNFYLEGRALVERLFPDSSPVTALQYSEMVLNNIVLNLIGEPTVVMLHKRVFEEFGDFNPHLMVSCDTEYWIRVGIHTGVIPVAENLASFRVHGDSVSARSFLNRDYRVNVLEPLAMLHEVVFNSRYAPLREVAEDLSVNLTQQFRSKALWAYGIAKRAAKDDQNPDISLLREWQNVALQFRRFSTVPLRYSLFRQWRILVGRCCGWREAGN
jgi:glycosyltransferase involved in cell wall biosynthesis